MNKENKRKSLFFTLSITFLMLIFSFFCVMPSAFIVSASAEENISTYSDVDVNDVKTRFEIYKASDVISNIPSDIAYFDSSLTNDGNNNILSNGSFHWTNGANVMNNDIGKLVFTLNMDTTESLINEENMITLYRANKDTNTSTPLLSIMFVSNDVGFSVQIKQESFGSELLGVAFDDSYLEMASSGSSDNGWVNVGLYVYTTGSVEDNNLAIDSGAMKYAPFYGTTSKQLHIVVDTEYLTDTYFVRSVDGITGSDNYIDSKIVSVYDIVKQMQERDELSYLDEDQQAHATELLNDGTIKKIQVSWLEEIEGTPFATKHYGWVEIPVVSNMVSPSDVATALGKESFAVGSSMCQYFQEDSATGIFNAYYLKNIWLSSKDANGNSMNLFLDINKSYRDYYYPFLRDEIFTQGMYEWFWSTMIVKYPQIASIDDSELYGYFGYTSVPYTYTLSQLVYEMFDGSPNMDGVVQYYSYRDNLSYESYMKLLDDYNYGWLSKAWNTIAGFVAGCNYPADHYFFYCDGTQDNAFIGENGAEDINDNKSSFANGVKDVVEDISDGLAIIFDNELTKWLALAIGLFLITWFVMFFFTSFFKVKKARQEYKNAKRRRKR